MSILVGRGTRVLVQGITGWQATLDTGFSLAYGVRVAAGVTPGKEGERVHGVPVYNTVVAALREHPADATCLYVPARALKDAALEAIEARIPLVHMIPERVPQHDLAEVFAHARRAGVRVVGPNSNGLISPGRTRLGGVGGEDPSRMFLPGPVGIVSRSGGMLGEVGWQLKRRGIGVSTGVSMGGDLMVGTPMAGFLELFEEDPETELVVLFGEPGTTYEEDAAAFIRAGRFAKPAVALIAGRFLDRYPQGVPFGHAAAMVSRGTGSPAAKVRALREAGVRVAETLEELPALVEEALAQARSGGRT